MHSDKKNHKLK